MACDSCIHSKVTNKRSIQEMGTFMWEWVFQVEVLWAHNIQSNSCLHLLLCGFYDFPTPTGEIIDTRTRKIHATHVGPTKILLVVPTHCISPQPSMYLPHKPSSGLSNLGICFWTQAYLRWDPLSDRLGSKVWLSQQHKVVTD